MKNSKKIIFVILMFGIGCRAAFPQIFSDGVPLYKPQKGKLAIPEMEIDMDWKEKDKPDIASPFKSSSFAQPVTVNINPEKYGKWIEFPEFNKKIWLLAVKVKEASSLSLVLNPFRLEEGAKLFFYNEDQSLILGAITASNNKASGVLPVTTLASDVIICELQMPMYQEEYGAFSIEKIGAGFPLSNLNLKSPDDQWFASSAACNVNANCYDYLYLDELRRSVCRILYNASGRCTGTLINNLNNDETPYVLTAAHCLNTDEIAQQAVFNFGYLSPDCISKDVKPLSVSGASVVSAGHHLYEQYDTLDFVLLKLSEKPPLEYKVYYSGWDASGIEADSTLVLHHPLGDIMKISVDEEPVVTGNFPNYFDKYTHWSVENYEEGTTEPGSSGSGLFDPKGKLIGTLTGDAGGDGTCGVNIRDKFQKMYHSYADYEDKEYQLKYWLDPKDSGKLVCNGYDPYVEYMKSTELKVNYREDEIPVAETLKVADDYLAGHSNQKNTLFAEHFLIDGNKYLIGVTFNLAMAKSTAPAQYVSFLVWDGSGIPANVIYEKRVAVSNLEDSFQTNPNASHTIYFDSAVFVGNSFYVGYKIAYSGNTFALKTIPADKQSSTAFTYLNGSWGPLQMEGQDVYRHLSMGAYVVDIKKGATGTNNPQGNITPMHIYPNPVKDELYIEMKEKIEGKLTCTIYNINGQPVIVKEYNNPDQINKLTINLNTGVYIVQVKTDTGLARMSKLLVF